MITGQPPKVVNSPTINDESKTSAVATASGKELHSDPRYQLNSRIVDNENAARYPHEDDVGGIRVGIRVTQPWSNERKSGIVRVI